MKIIEDKDFESVTGGCILPGECVFDKISDAIKDALDDLLNK